MEDGGGGKERGGPRLRRPISSKLVKPLPPKAKTSDRSLPPSLPPSLTRPSIDPFIYPAPFFLLLLRTVFVTISRQICHSDAEPSDDLDRQLCRNILHKEGSSGSSKMDSLQPVAYCALKKQIYLYTLSLTTCTGIC